MATSAPTISSNSLTRARTELDTLAAAGEYAGRRDRLARRTHRRPAREHRAAGRRDPRRCRHDASAKRRAAPTGSLASAARDQAGDRLDPRCGRRGERPDLPRPARRSPSSRTASRRCSRRVDDGVGDAQSKLAELASVIVEGRARGGQPQRRNRPGAGRRAASRSRKPPRMPPSARARRSRASSRRAPANCPKRRARRSSGSFARASRNGCARSRTSPPARSSSARAASDRLTQQMLTLGQTRCRARAAYRADQQGSAREGQRGVRPTRVAADGFDELGRDRRRQDPVRRNRRQGVGQLPQGQSRRVHPPRGAADRRQRDAARSRRITTAIPSSSSRSTATSTISKRCFAACVAERDGGMIAVTLMSSDMGKLYAALAQIDRRR